ncbi:MAG: hypothetical protein ACKVPY_07205 [Paracoccaceae bacterium]
MDIFGGVDGTGTDDDKKYAVEFANSHVNTLFKQWTTPHRFYDRGPALVGAETGDKARMLAMAMKASWQIAGTRAGLARTPNRLFIAGYSRGAAAAVEACHMLKDAGIPVHCLMLFDAVERTNTVSRTTVPGNVRHCFHARRDPSAASRQSFSNCSTRAEPGVKYSEKFFFCTHGGVGGCPWSKAAEGGVVSEWDGGWALAAHLLDTAFRMHTGIPVSPVRGLQNTRVTPAQDKTGSRASWDWMHGNLMRARAEGTGDFPNPGRFGNFA